jgi:hypothetical protein
LLSVLDYHIKARKDEEDLEEEKKGE